MGAVAAFGSFAAGQRTSETAFRYASVARVTSVSALLRRFAPRNDYAAFRSTNTSSSIFFASPKSMRLFSL
jgi:hypothetical protein